MSTLLERRKKKAFVTHLKMADISIIILYLIYSLFTPNSSGHHLAECSKLLTLKSYTEEPYVQKNCPSSLRNVRNDEYTDVFKESAVQTHL